MWARLLQYALGLTSTTRGSNLEPQATPAWYYIERDIIYRIRFCHNHGKGPGSSDPLRCSTEQTAYTTVSERAWSVSCVKVATLPRVCSVSRSSNLPRLNIVSAARLLPVWSMAVTFPEPLNQVKPDPAQH